MNLFTKRLQINRACCCQLHKYALFTKTHRRFVNGLKKVELFFQRRFREFEYNK